VGKNKCVRSISEKITGDHTGEKEAEGGSWEVKARPDADAQKKNSCKSKIAVKKQI